MKKLSNTEAELNKSVAYKNCEKKNSVFECRCPCQCQDADTDIFKWPNKNIGKKETSAISYNRKLNNISKFVRCYLLRVNSCNSILTQFN